MWRPLVAETVPDYNDTDGERSPERESADRAVQMSVDHHQRRFRTAELFIGEFHDQRPEEQPPVPSTLGEVPRRARAHDGVQNTRGAHVPLDPRTQPQI